MPAIYQANNLSDLLKYEAPGYYSRDLSSIEAGQNLRLGEVIGIVTLTHLGKAFNPLATDGSEIPVGVMLADCDASLISRDDGLYVARHASVSSDAVIWPAAITEEQKAAAAAKLKQIGVLIRLPFYEPA